MNLCDYGCGQEAKLQLKNGKWCCSKSYNSCPISREKNKKSHLGVLNHRYGKHCTEETKKKISLKCKGEKNYWYGRKHTEETKKKMSENNKGMKGRNHSEETKKKMSESRKCEKNSMYGKTHNEDSKKIMSEKKKGKTHTEETKKKMSESRKGENHPSWKGGISNNPYCPIFSNKEFRSIIYKRDSNTCQLCGCTKQLNHKLTSRKVLTIHHIDGDKMNCDLRNCILVCQRCNTHVENKKLRKFYQYNFQNIMVLKYS